MELNFRTGNKRADDALESLVGAFEETFPGERCRYVVLGSYATGSARDTSDLDVLIVFAHTLTDDDRAQADRLIARQTSQLSIEADIGVCSVDDCRPVWAVALRAGRTVFGNPTLAPPLPTIEDYTLALIDDVLSLMRGLRPGQALSARLEAPNPQLPILGYEAKPLRDAQGRWAPSTKVMSMITSWGASALIAQRAGQFVATKDEVIDLYRSLIGDEWTNLLVAVDRECRQAGYVLPTGPAAVGRMQHLARQILSFENYLLETFTTARR